MHPVQFDAMEASGVIDKRRQTADEAVAGIKDGSTVLIGGFGMTGEPRELCSALAARKVRGLTIVTNNAGSGEFDLVWYTA